MIKRKRYDWRLRSREFTLGEKTLVIGVIDTSPEAGRFAEPERALERALELEAQGADVIELIAQSARPGRLTEAEEIRRLAGVTKRLKKEVTAPVVVETWKAPVAAKVLDNGADGIRDISGLAWDPDLAKLTVQHDAALILNYLRGTPDNWGNPPGVGDVVDQIVTGLAAAAHRANRANVDRRRIAADISFGFGKRRDHHQQMVALLPHYMSLELPLIAAPTGQPWLLKGEEESAAVQAAATLACIISGSHMVRVHDVAALKPVAELADALVAAQPATLRTSTQQQSGPVRPRVRAAERD